MTTTHAARRLALAALALCVIAAALIAALTVTVAQQPAQPAAAAPIAVAPVVAPAPVVDAADPLLVALMPDADLDPAHAEQLTLAGDRVCEGVVAGTPVVAMADALVRDLGLTDTEARTFVAVAAQVRGCPAVDPTLGR